MNEQLTALAKKALSDPKFKAELLKSPNAAAEKAGVKLPPGVELKVVEDSTSHVHLVLPPAGA